MDAAICVSKSGRIEMSVRVPVYYRAA
eukprot:COSAG06_NODE_36229_length_450_cov_0.598291_1_plen_26_part_10